MVPLQLVDDVLERACDLRVGVPLLKATDAVLDIISVGEAEIAEAAARLFLIILGKRHVVAAAERIARSVGHPGRCPLDDHIVDLVVELHEEPSSRIRFTVEHHASVVLHARSRLRHAVALLVAQQEGELEAALGASV
ncbi:MAG: hypothetical protein KC731_22440 [Myxococcales bacterium]|nr:hypothetical protein [Myxococcales bacterium]